MFTRKKQFCGRKDSCVLWMFRHKEILISKSSMYGCRVWRGLSLEKQVGEPVIYLGGNSWWLRRTSRSPWTERAHEERQHHIWANFLMAKIWFLVLSSRETFPLTSITSGHRVLCSVNRDHREQSKIINSALKIRSLPFLPTVKEKLYNGPTKVTILCSSQVGGSCIQVLNGKPNTTHPAEQDQWPQEGENPGAAGLATPLLICVGS